MQIQLPANLTAGCRENTRDRAEVWFVLFSHFRLGLFFYVFAPCMITWVYTAGLEAQYWFVAYMSDIRWNFHASTVNNFAFIWEAACQHHVKRVEFLSEQSWKGIGRTFLTTNVSSPPQEPVSNSLTRPISSLSLFIPAKSHSDLPLLILQKMPIGPVVCWPAENFFFWFPGMHLQDFNLKFRQSGWL